MIYFVQGDKGGPIKIGYTENDIQDRIRALQVGYPQKLELVCLIEGGKAKERRIHNTFVSSRLQGEWFSPDQKILDYIDYLHINEHNLQPQISKTIDAIGG